MHGVRGKGETQGRRKLEKIDEMTEDSSGDTDHHHTPGRTPRRCVSKALQPCTVFTRRWYRIVLQDLPPLHWTLRRPGVRGG